MAVLLSSFDDSNWKLTPTCISCCSEHDLWMQVTQQQMQRGYCHRSHYSYTLLCINSFIIFIRRTKEQCITLKVYISNKVNVITSIYTNSIYRNYHCLRHVEEVCRSGLLCWALAKFRLVKLYSAMLLLHYSSGASCGRHCEETFECSSESTLWIVWTIVTLSWLG